MLLDFVNGVIHRLIQMSPLDRCITAAVVIGVSWGSFECARLGLAIAKVKLAFLG
ncbi:MAG: hypothetical protein U0796_15085 [Gemmatales bacterium]